MEHAYFGLNHQTLEAIDAEFNRHLLEVCDREVLYRLGRETLSPSDFGRFRERKLANDECVNIFVAAFNFQPKSGQLGHFGSNLGFPKPPGDFHVLTTFFYPQLENCAEAWNEISSQKVGSTEAFQAKSKHLLRWFKKVDMTSLTRLLIPVHQKAEKHWLLAVIYFKHEKITFIESWGPNQAAYRTTGDFSSVLTHQRIYENCRLLIFLLLTISPQITESDPMKDPHKWNVNMIEIPPQRNEYDCGFYLLMSIFHLLSFDSINPAGIPAVLHIHGATMAYTRLILASNLAVYMTDYEIWEAPQSSRKPATKVSPFPSSTPGSPTDTAPTITGLEPAFEFKETTPGQPKKGPDLEPGQPEPTFSPVESSVDGEDMLLPHDTDFFPLPSPLANLSPLAPLPKTPEVDLHIDNSPPSPVHQSEPPLSRILPREFDFSCRCGDHGPDGSKFANGLEVIQCERCLVWSHMSCQRFGRATGLRKTTPFFCDRCMRTELPIPSPPKAGRQRTQRIQLKAGMGALAKYGKFHYPVRLLLRLPGKQAWRVRFWRKCVYPPDVSEPNPEAAIPEGDLVDSLYGNQAARRHIRLGKYTHAHDVPVEEDVLSDFQNQPFSPRVDTILGPHLDVLFSIFSEPLEQNSHIPSVQYQAEIMNWIYNTIPHAKDHLTDWVGLPTHAHAITIVIAALNEEELRLYPDFPSQESEASQIATLWEWAWELQQHRGRVPVVDVDRECLGLFEQWMFESSDEAGLAGDEQWAWSSYRSGFEDNTKYERGPDFSDDGLSEKETPPPALKAVRIKPRPKRNAKK
ncbi:hypothetical protein C8F04DRAFT_1061422 [Mycena alexandri]|uniref:Ubiquitin-like protease family profile domain-containing protein n=1 Tax=Mycena alexandri TaxID=1745969 RepID=A0AAD6XBW5_9AGAR|nr:hypothetical protein C8F04DRAFT_1061422 [Mycena alexandri]